MNLGRVGIEWSGSVRKVRLVRRAARDMMLLGQRDSESSRYEDLSYR